MKKIAVIVILILLTACAPTEKSYINYDPIEHNFLPYQTPFKTNENGYLYLTREQVLEDYYYMWKTLEENAPYLSFMPDYPRWADNTPEQIKERHAEIIKNAPEKVLLHKYHGYINDTLLELNPVGHIGIAGNYIHEMMRTIFAEMAETAPQEWRNVLHNLSELANNEKTNEFYRLVYGATDSGYVDITDNYSFEEIFDSGNQLGMAEDSVPYIRISSFITPAKFTFEYEEYSVARYKAFLEQNKNAENIIIDIRGNGGGSTNIWSKCIVELLIAQGEKLPNYEFLGVLDGGLNTYIRGEDYPYNLREDWQDIFPNITDVTQFDRLVSNDNYSADSDNSIGFNGNIWLLVDGGCYSASEAFTIFCKQTGFATVVGTQTGGSGVGGNPYAFPLPNSGLLIRYEGWYAFNDDGTCNQIVGTKPDIDVGRRDALEVCLELIAAG
ncbi:MAG: S41 family peptidase [Oscillospiraceae bacterium]|nr:S41 family peptidase [Oscillospiraceae bacterium]